MHCCDVLCANPLESIKKNQLNAEPESKQQKNIQKNNKSSPREPAQLHSGVKDKSSVVLQIISESFITKGELIKVNLSREITTAAASLELK